jgi:hypothetical protein
VAKRGGGLIASVKARDDIELIEVTRANRDRLAQELAERWRRVVTNKDGPAPP